MFVAWQWRLGGITVAGVVASNLAVYLLWPRDFPGTIVQSIRYALACGNFYALVSDQNVSFAPRSLIGWGVLVLVVVALMALGWRASGTKPTRAGGHCLAVPPLVLRVAQNVEAPVNAESAHLRLPRRHSRWLCCVRRGVANSDESR